MTTFPTRGFRRTRERASGLLFALGIDDLSPVLTTGQTLSLTRASDRTVYDSTGRVATITHSQLPWSAAYNSSTAQWEPTLDVHTGRTNLVLRSEDFSASWTAIGSPTRTAAAAACGDLSLDLIGDDAAGTLEGYSQVVSFTANAVKAVSLFIKQGTSTSSVIRLRDTTASANRLLATVTWSGSTPSVAMTTGTYIGASALANGVYRLLFQTSSVTAANTNQLELYPATTSALAVANTGTLYVGGVMAENITQPRPYVKTLGATVSHDKDHLVTTVAFLPQTLTAYLRIANPTAMNGSPTVTASYFTIGIGGGAASYISVLRVNSSYRAMLYDAAGTLKNVDVAATGGDTVSDLCAQFDALTTAPRVRLDIGDGAGFSAWTTTGVGFSTWTTTSMGIGTSSSSTAGGACDAGIRKLILAPGARTLDEMRGLNV